MNLKLILAGLAASASVVTASTVANYAAGVAPTAGTTGAADPTTQGWTANAGAGTTAFSHGLDSTIGGWRITDGTDSRPFFYQHTISLADATAMASNDWTATWTTAVNADAINSGGGGVDDYYAAGGAGVQNDNAMWIELAGGGWYVLTFNVDANNDIQVNDGTNTFQITTANNQLSQELGAGAPLANYVTFTLTSTGGAAPVLTDSLGGSHGTVATVGTGSTNRVVWGATSTPNQGSTTWNTVNVDVVPEPGAALLGALGLLLIARRRR